MGEAKRRGSYEERKKLAEAKAAAEQEQREQYWLARRAVLGQKDKKIGMLMAIALGMAEVNKR